jgi:hypothetical protein
MARDARCFIAACSRDYLLDRFRAPAGASVGYSRSSDFGTLPHQDHFGPDATPTVRLAGSSRSPVARIRRRPNAAVLLLSGGHPYLPVSPSLLRPHRAVNTKGSPASGLVRDRFDVSRDSFNRALASGESPSASHRPTHGRLSERCLAPVDYSCRRSSSVSSKARGATPDFVRPPFTHTGLPPGMMLG